MKITDVRFTSISKVPLKRPFWNSIVRTTSRDWARVEIYTDEGAVGMAPAKHSSGFFVESAIKTKLLGEDPFRVEYLWQKMYMGGTRKPVARGEYIVAMSAVDNALWDLKGKILGQPVWKLLGGAKDRVLAYAAGGYYEEGKGLKELCREMEGFVKQGFRAVKMKVGWPGVTLFEDAERVRAVRETIGPDIELMVDANNAWDANTAIRFGRMIEPYRPYWFEEPVRADDLRGGAMVASALDIPVASGENEFTHWGFRDLIECGAAEIIQADPNTCGGISQWIKIAALAEANHLPMSPHGDASIGSTCTAAVENGLMTENYLSAFLDESVEPVDFRDGYIYMPDRPGLGLVWKEGLVERN
ncbi:MAG: mandelate racemase/muconate lactonizing enzyme family protein [Deltaproteobacteria bacterium]|nr:mandelate racemase/muconate lactonizing enzyme family protein [Deltaproteobacteria bacterium]